MSKIYSSLSNPSGDLGELKKEFAGIFNFFNSNTIKRKVDFGFSLNPTVDEITSEIIAGQREIRLFQFSGHSGGSGLDFTEAQFKSEHLIKFFNTISSDESKIDCVFLNGCENETIVRQLSRVPVVIGTRSKIQDQVARKFTKDFFNALIKSGSTYHQSFLDATSAIENISRTIQDNTRSEGGSEEFEAQKPLNNYFLVINDKRIAESTFPFKRGKTNWTKYLLLLFVAIALFLVWFFKDDIFLKATGYSCESITTDTSKCNFVIADFVTDQEIQFNEWLLQKIENTTIIKKYINAIDIGSFKNVIKNNSIHRDSLPSRCNYDFNLTGSYLLDINRFKAEFKISPSEGGALSLDTFSYIVQSLPALGTLITQLDSNNASQFLLAEMCIRCGLKNPLVKMDSVLKELLNTYNAFSGTAAYQRLNYDLAGLFLGYKDTSSALLAMDKISKAVGNDFALMAIERKVELFISSNNFLRAFDTQSDLITQFQARIQQPEQYILTGDLNYYKMGQNNVRFDRAMLVLKYKDDQLKGFKNIAIRDFEYLQSIKYPPGDFSKEIKILKGIQIDSISDHPVKGVKEFYLTGKVLTSSGLPLRNAVLTFTDKRTTTNSTGEFNLGTFPDTMVLGRPILISLKGFKPKSVKITKSPIGKIFLEDTVSAKLFNLQGNIFDESKQPLEGATLTFGNLKSKTNRAGQFDFGKITRSLAIGKTLSISRNGFLDKLITIDEKNINNIVLIKAPVALKVILQAVETDEGQYQKILSYLKNQKYQIDSQRSANFKTSPEVFSKVSSIIYYRDENKSIALALAKQFRTWTGQNLEVISLPFLSDSKSAIIKTDFITIQLKGTNKMFHLHGSVYTENGKPLKGALVKFEKIERVTDGNGLFDFGRFAQTEVIYKNLFVFHKEIQDRSITILEDWKPRIDVANKLPLNPPSKYTVYMRAIQINDTLYHKVASSLKTAGYPIDIKFFSNSRFANLKLEALIFKKENYSHIEYFHEGNRDRAIALAKQLKELTKVDFKINKSLFTKSEAGIPREEDILIQWAGTNSEKK